MRDFVKMIQEELDEFVAWVRETQEFDCEEDEFEYVGNRFWSVTADQYGLSFDFDEDYKAWLI